MREVITRIKNHYDQERLGLVDHDFLSFEEDLSTDQDLQLIEQALAGGLWFAENPSNSIILYVTGLTDQFDHERARADTVGGSPPDCI